MESLNYLIPFSELSSDTKACESFFYNSHNSVVEVLLRLTCKNLTCQVDNESRLNSLKIKFNTTK